LNIQATEFGQKFGDWSLFVEATDEQNNSKKYRNIALIRSTGDREFIFAKEAYIDITKGIVELNLNRGILFTQKDFKEVNRIVFENMQILNPANIDGYKYKNTLEYLDYAMKKGKRRKKIITMLLLSLFPITSSLLILILGIEHTRYSKGSSVLYAFLAIAVYYGVSFSIAKPLDLMSLFFPLIWFVGVYITYNKKIAQRF
jgi:lipopolysaccharide export system permease protein